MNFLHCEVRGCREDKHLDYCLVFDALICPAHRSVAGGEVICHACNPAAETAAPAAAPGQGEIFSQGGSDET